ncbi:MAG: gamma-glutamyltransferase [Candidatus Neomarinimicrobiota bacterium]|nr:MAG: gamma-glutamyltransferase [Candidatus Neomarinimicrobiota bacterium]
MKKLLVLYIVLIGYINGSYPHPVFGENGMVVSTSRQASIAGIEILKKGGNAIDAACATGFVLAVTSSSNGNIGGGGFMVVHKENSKNFTLDYREIAPAAAHRDMFLDSNGEVIDNMSLRTRAASGVPGSVDGLLKAWKDHGSGNISRRELLVSAIALAERGFELTDYEAKRFNNNKDLFLNNNAAAKIFIRGDGKPWKAGDRFIQKDLARTLKRIAREGRNGFYTGKTADLIIAEMNRGIGLITHEDLLNYESKYRDPMIGSFKEYEIISMGLPSSGGTILIEMLNMLENFSLSELGWNSSEYIHLLTEVERRAYADRAEHLGDADFWTPPLSMLTSKKYAIDRMNDFYADKATSSTVIFAGDPSDYESPETTHYSVIDKDGNAVSVTTTINLGYGGGFLVEGAGFFLNNEMDDFSVKPWVPNAFGLVGNAANAIQPGKRPLSSMTPTIVLKNKEPFIILGSPGGSRIITAVLQTILNVTVHNMNIQKAVSAPRVHSQWLPDVIMAESYSIIKDVETSLINKGHKILPYKNVGDVNAILINETVILAELI